MSSNKTNESNGILDQFKKTIKNPLLNGVIAIVGLLAMVLDSGKVVKIIAGLVLFGIIINFVFKFRLFILSILSWFTRKFLFGLILGIVVGAILMPILFKPVFYNLLTIISPKVYILESFPRSGDILLDATSSIGIRFSKAIPWPYYFFVKIEEDYNYPFTISWDSSHQMVYISPEGQYPSFESGGTLNPRFGYGENYIFHISAPFLAKPQVIEIISPNVIYDDK